MNEDLISVIIPAYNHEKYVQEAVESIINQTYRNIEIIVIDDESIDNTWQILAEMKGKCEKRFVRTVIERQKHNGSAAILNKGLKYANGKYLYLFSSDDIAHPQAIEKLHDNIGDADMIFPDIGWIDSESKRFYLDEKQNKTYEVKEAEYNSVHEAYTNKKWPDIDSPNFDFYATLLDENCLNIGFIVRTAIVRDIGGWKDGTIEDYYMHLQVAKRGKIKRLKDVLFFYRKHHNNWSNDKESIYYSLMDIFKNEMLYCCMHGYGRLWYDIYMKKYYKNDHSFLKKLVNIILIRNRIK